MGVLVNLFYVPLFPVSFKNAIFHSYTRVYAGVKFGIVL